jgi:hypothetical protein
MEVNEQMEYNSFQQFEPAPRRGEVQVCTPIQIRFERVMISCLEVLLYFGGGSFCGMYRSG